MKKTAKISFTIILTIAMILSPLSYQGVKAYTPRYTTLKVGIYSGSSALPSANLQNVTGYGSGYQFGILDDNRQFVPIGASTTETKISILRDRNMVYNGSVNCYDPGSTGSVVVGCFHIQMNTAFSTYNEASAAVSGYESGFVKYADGQFYGCVGNYISSEEANAAIGAYGISNANVTCGTASTVTVVKTGTNKVLFEFEYGKAYFFVVIPVSQGGEKCQTWFKGYRYYGGFQYARLDGGDVSVFNIVNIEDYVKGVLPYEMANTWPLEALKAQAVSARTYAMANLGKHTGFDVCTTQHCQVYRGVGAANSLTDSAVDQTAGQYLTYNGQLAVTYYTSSDGGATENSENVWAESVPYLRGVVDPYEAEIVSIANGYSWSVTYTAAEITARLRNKGYSTGTIVNMEVSQYTDVGNVYKVTLTDENGRKYSFTKGESIRIALGVSSIRFSINGASSNDIYVNSSNGRISGDLQSSYAIGGSGLAEILGKTNVYAITGSGDTVVVGSDEPTATPGVFVIKGTGLGHNVGMSQWGAYSMAKFHGKTYDQILKFYFTGTTIE